jgi:hypothetical protein
MGRPSASNPRGYSRYISGNFFASSFGFSMIRFQPLLACSHANLHRLVGVFLDVADRELLALDLFRFVLSQNLNLFSAPGMTSLCGGVQTCDRPGKGNKSVGTLRAIEFPNRTEPRIQR